MFLGRGKETKMKKLFVLALTIILTACGTATPKTVDTTGIPAVDLGPKVVIDSPANGTHAQMKGLVIQMHVTDPLGVARGEISANSQVIDIVEAPGHGKPTEVLTYAWQPKAPGDYQIGIRAQNTMGTWGAPVTLQVTIVEPTSTQKVETATVSIPTATATSKPPTENPQTPSPSPSLTITPTVSATNTPGGASTDPGSYGTSLMFSFTALHFYSANSSCYPNDSGMTVIVSDMTNVANVFAFFAMTDTGVYHFPDHRWTTGMWMWQTNPGSPYFWRKITSKSIIADVPYYPNYVLYQFIATDRYGGIVARSPIYRDMSIVQCKP
jgi:hypothetical protein